MTSEAGTVSPDQTQQSGQLRNLLAWLMVVGLIYLLITAVGTVSAGFKSATGGQARELFAFATNPFLGLLIGTIATARDEGVRVRFRAQTPPQDPRQVDGPVQPWSGNRHGDPSR